MFFSETKTGSFIDMQFWGNYTLSTVCVINERFSDLIACADIHRAKSKTAQAFLSWDNVKGSIALEQTSPFDFTKTTVTLSGLQVSGTQIEFDKQLPGE